jgi:hypothetical protein
MTIQIRGGAAISPAKDHHFTNSPSLNSHNKTIQKRLQSRCTILLEVKVPFHLVDYQLISSNNALEIIMN